MNTIFTPMPGDRVQVGRSLAVWTVGEIVNRPYPVGNLYDNFGNTVIGIPVSEMFVVIPYEARTGPKEMPLAARDEREVSV
jgi:hypothetical protein